MSIEALKEQARRHEQREEWREALDLYRRAISQHEAQDQPDIALYNRVGDLQTRLGHLDAAADAYERAVDLYVESELHNNAIAVCKKMIRHLPGRTSVFLRMGQIRAGQGFLVDARQNFLNYAERMQSLGDIDEAFRALIEFADLAPEDMDIRLAIAAQMHQRDRRDDALEQLGIGYRALRSRGRVEDAETFAEKILEMDPDADMAAIVTETAGAGNGIGGIGIDSVEAGDDEDAGGELELGFSEISVDEPAPGAPAAAGPARATPDSTEPELDDQEFTIVPRSAAEGGVDPDQVEGFEATSLGGLPQDDDSDDEVPPLPLLEPLDDEPVRGLEGPEASRRMEGALEEAVSEARAEPETADEPVSVEGPDEAIAAGGDEVEKLMAAGDLDGAMEVVRARIESEPGEVLHPQRLVELAFRAGDDAVLVEAYLTLAACLDRNDRSANAQAVYQQVLSLDPGNEIARSVLEGGSGTGPAAAGEVASSEDYIDLGALVLDEEDGEKTTRFVVAYEEPSGDEAADFANMLSQFKKKVAENVSADDVRAHHDLGTAYREMGLYDEAIQEYQQALRASATHLPTYELLGQCFIDKGEHEAAVRSMSRALDVPHGVEDELIGIYYHLGRAYESLGNTGSALEFYDRVFTLDINFADVTERLRALR